MNEENSMLSIHKLTLCAAIALASAPTAFAQDGDTAASDTASGKRVSIVGGYAMSEPTRNPEIAGSRAQPGSRAQLDGEGTPTLGVTYHVNDHIGIEAWGADKIGQRVNGADGQKIGSIEAQPYSLSGQYRFGAADNIVRPFVGLGYHETNYSGEQAQVGGLLDGQRVGVETAQGAVATVGVDVNINPTWFARADARYFQGDSDIRLNGARAGDAELNPVMLGVGVGARF
jgi:outer membrane protein